MREKYQQQIKNRIDSFTEDFAFSATDFFDIADTNPVNKALSRLNEEGYIRRIIQGIYDKPVFSSLVKEYISPNIDSVAQALSRKFNWTIAPAGDTALNYLHMSTQVPNRWLYISDGPYRKYEIGNYTLEFKHCANREVSGKSYIAIIIIQALKAIGENRIQAEDINRLKIAIKDVDNMLLLKESRTAPAWINRIIKEICI